MRKGMGTLAVLAAALAFGLPAALGGAAATTPGVTAHSILLGGTFPLTGAASSYAPIPRGMQAFFSYINARKGPDGKRGVGGRQIIWKYYDDAYNPTQTVQQTQRLVEQDKVFALVGGLGTEPQQAVRDYLNRRRFHSSTCRPGQRSSDQTTRSTRGRSGGSPTTSPKRPSTAGTSAITCRTRRSRCSTRTTTTARTTTPVSSAV